jgi:hypothetical protein
MIGKSIEKSVNVNVQCWVDKWSSVSFNVVVISFAFEVQRDLLHVRLPVNFGIFGKVSSWDELMNSRIRYMVSSILSHHTVQHRRQVRVALSIHFALDHRRYSIPVVLSPCWNDFV